MAGDDNERRRERGPAWILLATPIVALAIGLGLARWVLPKSVSSRRGADWRLHARLILRQAHPDAVDDNSLGLLASYPPSSHFLASRLLPVLFDDPVLAMRSVAWATLLSLYICQWLVFRAVLGGWSATLTLLVWQAFLQELKLANVNFFHGNYFYAQAVGSAALWWLVAWLIWTPTVDFGRPWRNGLSFLSAVLAFDCHLAPGLVAYACVVGAGILALRSPRRRSDMAFAGLAPILFVALIIESGQLTHMAENSKHDGTLELRAPLLTLLLSLGAGPMLMWCVWRVRSKRLPVWVWRLAPIVLVAGAALVLELAVVCRWLQGAVAPYAVKKILFLTVPSFTIVIACRLALGLARFRPPVGAGLFHAGLLFLTVALLVANLARYLEKEFREETPPPSALAPSPSPVLSRRLRPSLLSLVQADRKRQAEHQQSNSG